LTNAQRSWAIRKTSAVDMGFSFEEWGLPGKTSSIMRGLLLATLRVE
jgi:hypothetical protein